jgi:hypothetical protein
MLDSIPDEIPKIVIDGRFIGHKIEGDILWDIILSHDDDLRDEQYVKDREEWQRIQISEENVVRSEYHIPELSRQ